MDGTLILTGMKHCGKSTLGKKLACLMNIPFFDLDDIITIGLQGKTIRTFFIENGAEAFKEKEKEAVSGFIETNNTQSSILSTGGGIIDNKSAWNLLGSCGTTVYLKEDKKILYNRIIKNGVPPFLDKNDPENSFSELYTRRTEQYEKHCDYVLDLKGSGIDEALKRLTALIKETIHAR